MTSPAVLGSRPAGRLIGSRLPAESQEARMRIGFIGLGNMGGPMALIIQ